MSDLAPVAAAVRPSVRSPSPEALQRCCQQVESLFWTQLLSAWGRSGFGDALLGGGAVGRVLQAQRDAAVAEEMGRRGELGLARLLYEQLSRGLRAHSEAAHRHVPTVAGAHKEERHG